MFDWFSAKEAQQFGADVVGIVVANMPPVNDGKKGKKDLLKRASIIDRLRADAYQFSKKNSLNVYKKAKFGATVKLRLVELGYEQEFIEALVKELLIAMK